MSAGGSATERRERNETPCVNLGVVRRSSHAWGGGRGEPGGFPAWSPRRMRGVLGGRRGLVGRKHGFPCSRNDIASDVVGAAGMDAGRGGRMGVDSVRLTQLATSGGCAA